MSKVKKIIGSNQKIDKNLHHRVKVVNRKREIEKLKNDMLNEQIFEPTFHGTHPNIAGEYGIRKAKQKRKENVAWICLWVLVLGLLIISLFI